MRITAPDTQLVLLRADHHTRRVLFNDKGIDPMTALGHIRLRHYDIYRCRIAIGDPILHAVQQIMIPHVHGRRPLGSGITARLRLAQQKGPDIQFAVLSPLRQRR